MIRVDQVEDDEIETFPIDDDINVPYRAPAFINKKSKKQWKPIFDPKAFWKNAVDREIDDYRLTQRQLKAAAKQAIDLRGIIIKKANSAIDDVQDAILEGFEVANKQSKKLRKRGTPKAKDPNEIHPSEYKEDVPPPHRRRSRTQNKI